MSSLPNLEALYALKLSGLITLAQEMGLPTSRARTILVDAIRMALESRQIIPVILRDSSSTPLATVLRNHASTTHLIQQLNPYYPVLRSTKARVASTMVASLILYYERPITITLNIQRFVDQVTDVRPTVVPSSLPMGGTPYHNLSLGILQEICRCENILVAGSYEDVIAALIQYESIMPDFVDRSTRISASSSPHLKALYMARRGVTMRESDEIPAAKLHLLTLVLNLEPFKGFQTQTPRTTRRSTLDRRITLNEAVILAEEGILVDAARITTPTNPMVMTLLQSIAEYPSIENAGEIISLSRDETDTAGLLYLDSIAFTLSEGDIKFGLLHGWLPPVLIEGLHDRLDQTKELRKRALSTLARIGQTCFGASSSRDGVVAIIRNPPTLLETYLSYCLTAADGPVAVATSLGMVVPPGQTPMSYILLNLHAYHGLLHRSQAPPALDILAQQSEPAIKRHLQSLTDLELFDYLGAHFNHTTRELLIDQAVHLFKHEGFFIPTRIRSVNTHTVAYNEVSEPGLPLIALGMFHRYHAYEVEDFLDAITERGSYIFFGHPEGGSYFSLETIIALRGLLEHRPAYHGLYDRIVRGIRNIQSVDPQIQSALTTYQTIGPQGDEIVWSFLNRLFETGMYMRRWTGTGPYPLRESDTTDRQIDPMVNTTVGLNDLEDLLARNQEVGSFLRSLPLFVYRNRYSLTNGTIESYLTKIRAGNQCIRQASSILIATAIRYGHLLFDRAIADINMGILDGIY